MGDTLVVTGTININILSGEICLVTSNVTPRFTVPRCNTGDVSTLSNIGYTVDASNLPLQPTTIVPTNWKSNQDGTLNATFLLYAVGDGRFVSPRVPSGVAGRVSTYLEFSADFTYDSSGHVNGMVSNSLRMLGSPGQGGRVYTQYSINSNQFYGITTWPGSPDTNTLLYGYNLSFNNTSVTPNVRFTSTNTGELSFK